MATSASTISLSAQGILDALQDEIAVLDAEGRIVAVNAAWTAFAAANGASMTACGVGSSYLHVCENAHGPSSDEADLMAAAIREVMRTGQAGESLVYPCHSASEERWFRACVVPYPAGGAGMMLVTHTNVTKEHQYHAQLRTSELMHRRSLETSYEGVVFLDALGRIAFANPRFASQIGVPAERLIGETIFDFMLPEYAFEQRNGFARRQRGKSSQQEIGFLRTDGTELHVLAASSAFMEEGEFIGALVMMSDITARKHAEARLADTGARVESERRRLDAVLRALPVAVEIYDTQGALLLANDVAHALRLQEYDSATNVAPRPGGAGSFALAGAFENSAPVLSAERRVHPELYVAWQAVPLAGPDDGLPEGIVVVSSDVTQRVTEEEQRRLLLAEAGHERDRLDRLLQRSPAFTVIFSGEDYIIQLANAAYRRLMRRDDVVGRSIFELVPPETAKGYAALLEEVWSTGEPVAATSQPVTVARADSPAGRPAYIDYVVQRLTDEQGEPLALVAHGVDVTTHVEMEQHVRQSEQRYRGLVEMSPDGILIHRDGIITYANAAAASILAAADPAQLLGVPVLSLIHADSADLMTSRMHRVHSGEVPERAELQWVGFDSRQRAIEQSSRLLDRDGTILTLFRDTTERRALEDELRRAQRMEALGRLAGGIAHDFNNLLGVMMSYVGMMLEDVEPGSPQADDLREVHQAIERAAALTRQLLTFGRQVAERPEAVDLRAEIEATGRLLRRVIPENIDITIEADSTEPVSVITDVAQLGQVVMNLVVNARDAMPEGGRLLIRLDTVPVGPALASVHGVAPGTFARLRITDNGRGIEESVRSMIFEPFFTTKGAGRGTGLGLPIVYGVARQHGGFVTVESTLDVGSTFSVYLPLARDREDPSAAPAERQPPSRRIADCTILLVEDDEILRNVTSRILRRQGFNVMSAAGPLEALALATSADISIDAMVSDVVMPTMSGLELAERVRRDRPMLPIMFLSGYARDVAERSGGIPADMPLLQKPIRAGDLVAALQRLLGIPPE